MQEVVRILFNVDGVSYVADSPRDVDVSEEENKTKALQKFIKDMGTARMVSCMRMNVGLSKVQLKAVLLNIENAGSIEITEIAIIEADGTFIKRDDSAVDEPVVPEAVKDAVFLKGEE